jgi:hypothetical protein
MTISFPYVSSGQSEMAKFLLSRGARVDVESSFLTPLQIASHRGYAGILKTLLDHNADVICQLHSFICYLSTLVLLHFPLRAVFLATLSHWCL